MTIVFAPQEAKVVVSTVIFKFSEGEEGLKVLKLSAIGKYPFLTINQEKLDFQKCSHPYLKRFYYSLIGAVRDWLTDFTMTHFTRMDS